MVPNGWFTLKLDEIVKKTQLGSTERHKGDSCQSPIPLLKMGNLNWGGFNLTSLELLPLSKVEEALLLNKGDFLFNTRNTPQLVGKSAVWNGELEKATFDNNINKIMFHDDRADSFYMGYYLNTGIGKSKIRSLSAGSTSVAAIYWKDLKNIRIELPPIEEQRKIAKILSTWDKAISTTEHLIDNSKQQKKALMQQLLTGKKRLLDESGIAFEGEWEEVKLENVVAKTQLGTSERTKENRDLNVVPLIKMGNLTWGGFNFNKLETVPKSIVDESLALQVGDFIFNTRNTPELVGKSAVWKGQFAEATFDNNINRISFNPSVNTDFICFYLNHGKGKAIVNSLPAGSTSVAAIYWKDLKNIKVPLPTTEEQTKIVSLLVNADKEIELLAQQYSDLKQEKKALMQQLLTGKRRVKVEQTDLKAN